MPEPIVGRIASLEPSREAAETKPLEREMTVRFADGQTARLSPDAPDASTYARILERLHARQAPAYVEVDARQTIQRLLLPKAARIQGLTRLASGDVEVELELSHAVHVLEAGSPSFDAFHEALARARASGAPVWVTETLDEHTVLDVREVQSPFERAPGCRSGEIPPFTFESLRPIPETRAEELFHLVQSGTCDPEGQPAGCIPFLYPDDGCWARAHAMCRRIGEEREQAGKVWSHASHSFHVSTPNHPACQVSWRWHVVPVLRVGTERSWRPWVLDPSLFDGAVPLEDWVAAQAQGFPLTLVWTDASVFYRDPVTLVGSCQRATEKELQEARDNLSLRSLRTGPPPYAHCLRRGADS